MEFNVAICHSIRLTRHLLAIYPLHQQTLEQVRSAKNLELTMTTWNGINMFLKFLVKQLRHWVFFGVIWLLHLGIQRKLIAYKILVRPQLEYAAHINFGILIMKLRWRKCRRQQSGGPAGDGGTGVASTICWTNLSGHPWWTAG